MSLAQFSVKNPVLVNMAMLIIFILGIFSAVEIPKESMPAIEFGQFVVVVLYPGVTPAEMENLVLNKLEEELSENVNKIDYISGAASEGKAVIIVVMEPDADIDKAENELNRAIDKVRDLPEDALDPILIRINMREVNPICDIVMGGEFSGNAIREISEHFEDGIMEIENISKVETFGTREREIWIEGDLEKMNELGINLSEITSIINRANFNLPGGKTYIGTEEFLSRTTGEFEHLNDIRNLPLRMDSNGRAIRILDIASVKDTLAVSNILTRYEGKNSIDLSIYKKENGNIITVVADIKQFIKQFQKQVPELDISLRNDSSIEVENSIGTLSNSAIIGVFLVFISLFIFLGWRNALMAALGIPFTFLMSFFIMQYAGITMNNLSLFALILVLGMVVDDAIVVIENVYRYIEMGFTPAKAAIKGTKEIMWPVISAVATTAVAFLPMLLMEGMMGKFMRVFPIVVTIALAASLFECLLILPSHLAEYARPVKKESNRRDQFRHNLINNIIAGYQPILKLALRNRMISAILVICLLLASFASMAGGLVKFEFFPKREPKTIVLKVKTPVGTSLEDTENVVEGIEKYLRSMNESRDIESVISTVGLMIENHQFDTKTSNAEIKIDLVEKDDMIYTHDQIKNTIRTYIDRVPMIRFYKFDVQTDGPPTGNDVEIRIKGKDLDKLAFLGKMIKDILAIIPGVHDITDSFVEGKKEIRIKPDYDKLLYYGISYAELATYINTASSGTEISKYRGDGNNEYKIILRIKEHQIDTLTKLKNLKITTPNGSKIAIKDIAELTIESGLAAINHRDEKRTITVTAECGSYTENGISVTRSPEDVAQLLFGDKIRGLEGELSGFSSRFPGYSLDVGGISEERNKSYNSLYVAFMIALLFIFTILATQFKSYIQPLVVMLTIPFSFIGVISGLIIMNLPFSLNTLIAVVALAGIVVNDSLVLVDFVNKERENGVDRWNSLINAGSTRIRPILLTTVTTIFGLMPMILSTSKAAEDWKPMAVSIAFGLGFATILTLVVIPVFYSLIDSVKAKFTKSDIARLSYEEAVK